jgi:hypothetical protein
MRIFRGNLSTQMSTISLQQLTNFPSSMPSAAIEEKPDHDSAVTEQKLDHIVNWDGPDDATNPRNWKKGMKTAQVVCVSAFTLYSNLAAIMFAPGAPDLVADFHITNTMVATLTVSIYILGFVFGPFFLASLSEIYGRLWLYHICNVVYLAFTIGCALSTNTAMFLVFRFICGCAASGPMTIGGGTIADLYEAEGRGKAMALFGLGPLLGKNSVVRIGCETDADFVPPRSRSCHRSRHRWVCYTAPGLGLDFLDHSDTGKQPH